MDTQRDKISPFEFAIMQIADPEKAKNYEPYTSAEVLQQRKDNLEKRIRQLKIKQK